MARRSVARKSNEDSVVRDLLEELDISSCLMGTDAMNSQKENAKLRIKGKGNYVLIVLNINIMLNTQVFRELSNFCLCCQNL